jgi:hypothetical protein
MSPKTDYVAKHYKPLQDKTLENALARRIGAEFPRLGGSRIHHVCARMVLEVVEAHLRPRHSVRHGQALWLAYSIDDPPRRGKRTADSELVPVILDLSTAEDIDARLARRPAPERLTAKAVRMCHQAFDQGGVLSNCDLAELLASQDSRLAHLLAGHEKRTGRIVPRRATVHDVGTGQTHKALICRKRYLEGKPPEQVARETYHSLEAVDRYLAAYDRVRHCRLAGMTPAETAYTLDCSLALVEQYLAIDAELEAHTDA